MGDRIYTSLDAVEELRGFVLVEYDDDGCECDSYTLGKCMGNELNLIEQDLQVLQIIKKCPYIVEAVGIYNSFESFEQHCRMGQEPMLITEEEWDKVRAWRKWRK